MQPETISHYRVLRKLGEGGMGEVYLAEDPRLHRHVAVKVLPAETSRFPERIARFYQEARAASALNHPNILTIFDAGSANDTHFIVTEYIDGETLRQKIVRGPLEIPEAIDVAIGIASALVAAHDGGIVHRDIKPENIMVRHDGHPKVLDFGIAKLTERQFAPQSPESWSRDKTKTDPRYVKGTVQYMSPEQLRGQDVDGRSDLFALGVVMFEMITGSAPFVGVNSNEIVAAVLDKDPPPISWYSEKIPLDLERIVTKTLRKNAQQRYQTAKDLLADLRTLKQELEFREREARSSGNFRSVEEFRASREYEISTGAFLAAKAKRYLPIYVSLALLLVVVIGTYVAFKPDAIGSIAVLPFENVSRDPDNDYLSEGITDSIIHNLSQLPKLHVTARSTVFQYRGKTIDPVKIGRDLKVRAVLTGQLLQQRETLIIRANLIDVDRGTQLWGAQYNRNLADILALQEEISRDISEKLRLRLTGEEKELLATKQTDDAEAYNLYLRGRFYLAKQSEESVKKAIEYFNEAIRRDPKYALAYAGLADSYYGLSNIFLPPKEAMEKAKEAATTALSLDDSLAEAHASLGLIRVWYDWDFARGEDDFRRAIELNPNSADAHRFYGDFLIAMGRFDEALERKRRAVSLDPISISANLDVARALLYADRYDEAIQQAERTLEMDPSFYPTHHYLGWAKMHQGRYSEAIPSLEKAVELSGRKPSLLATLAYCKAVSGDKEGARAIMHELEGMSKERYVLPFLLARIHSGLGETDESIKWLEEAFNARSESIVWLKIDPTFDTMRDHPRFVALLKRAGLG